MTDAVWKLWPELPEPIKAAIKAMAEASAVILDGFRLRSDARIVRWPDRYMDGRGREFWGRVLDLLPSDTNSARGGLPDLEYHGSSDVSHADLGLQIDLEGATAVYAAQCSSRG